MNTQPLRASMDPETGDPVERMAHVVLRDTLRVRPGENVTIEAWSGSVPWARAFVAEARRLGALPMTLYEDEELFWDAASSGKLGSLGKVGDHEWAALGKTDAYVFFFGPSEWPRFENLPERVRSRVQAYNREWYRRARRAKLRGARMFVGRTSPQAADVFHVDLDRWRDELVRATLVPPATMHRVGKKIAQRLLRGRTVRISHPNGTDLTLQLKQYPVQLDDGLVDADDLRAGNNMTWMPSGVVGAAVDESFGEGRIVANRAVYLSPGPAEGGEWTLRDGRLRSFSYGRGAEHFEKPYGEAPKGRDQPGFLSIGLNPEISMSPQMEDQELGALTFRIGGNKFSGGRNPCEFFSWLVVRGADVSVDGRPLVTGGKIA